MLRRVVVGPVGAVARECQRIRALNAFVDDV
jgi:hypothetical protein